MTTLDIALGYIQRGWAPVPIPYREKSPGFHGWQNLRLTAATAPERFTAPQQNVGVVLGAASGGLYDVDLDCPEARAVAPYFLPATEAVFGRAGAPNSHHLYKCPGNNDPRTAQFNDPDVEPDDDTKKVRIVELRGKGSHTVFPPQYASRHRGAD